MLNIAGALPVACFVLLVVSLHGRQRFPPEGDWRCSWMAACVAWGVAVVFITEILSLWEALDRTRVLIAWTGFASLLMWSTRFQAVRRRERRAALMRKRWSASEGVSLFDRLLLAGVVVIVGCVGLVAILAPPNNWDSMTYHMARVAHWITNESVRFYPTAIDRQLYLGPLAEFVILQFQILTMDDRWANLIQWFSMVSSLVGVSLISARLGGGTSAQIVATVIAATIPMGILQASSTQNDYVLTFWLVAAVFYALRMFQATRPKTQLRLAIPLGASVGLALVTKSTAYIYALPLLVACVGWSVFGRGRRVRAATLATAGLMAAALNLGFWARNTAAFGSPIGSRAHTAFYANDVLAPAVTASNVIRNAGLHVRIPLPAVRRVHELLRLDMNDPGTSFNAERFDKMQRRLLHEDYAGNEVHAVLLILSILAALVAVRRRPRVSAYAMALVVGFIVFCAYLKWQPWASRLHLPLFVLGAPLIGRVVEGAAGVSLARAAAAVPLIGALCWVLFNESRPLFKPILPVNLTGAIPRENDPTLLDTSRLDGYFWNRPDIRGPYAAAAARVKAAGCRDVGVALGGDDYEYPLWVLFGSHARQGTALIHVTLSEDLTRSDPRLCAVIAVDGAGVSADVVRRLFQDEWRSTPVSVFTNRRRDSVGAQ